MAICRAGSARVSLHRRATYGGPQPQSLRRNSHRVRPLAGPMINSAYSATWPGNGKTGKTRGGFFFVNFYLFTCLVVPPSIIAPLVAFVLLHYSSYPLFFAWCRFSPRP